MNNLDLTFLGHSEDGYRVYKCPLCGDNIRVRDDVFYGRCDACKCTLIDYKPAPHQESLHRSKARYRLNIGGFGSGKTTADAFEMFKHIATTPYGKSLVTGQTLQQVTEAALPELDKFIPPWLLKKQPQIKPTPKYQFINGHTLLGYASNDADKLRSLNLTAFWMVEASGIDYSIFEQLQTRLRNKAAVIKDKDGREIGYKFMGLIETNPEDNWVRDEFLLRSAVIKASKSVSIEGYKKLKYKKLENAYHTFLSASVDNIYLPKTFISEMCAGKSDKWVRKYIYCSLEMREGVVYEDFTNCLVDPFPIKDNWLRIHGFDKGWSDATCMAMGAIDPYDGILYIYDEYYENKKPMSYHAAQVKEKVFGHKMYKNIQADPSIRNSNERDGVSYKEYFLQLSGLNLEEADNNLLNGIDRVRDFMYRGKLKIFTSCVNIKEEAQKYVYKTNKDGTGTDAPIDRHNHLMDALRYLVMSLPNDPRDCYIEKFDQETGVPYFERTPGMIYNGQGGVYGMEVY